MRQEEPGRVSVVGRSDERSGNVESAAIVSVEFQRGTLAAVLVSFRAHYRTPLEIVGDAGVLRADDALNVERSVNLELCREGQPVAEATLYHQLAYATPDAAFPPAVPRPPLYPLPR